MRTVVEAVDAWRRAVPGVLVVAIDGPGASGKTTIARQVAAATGAALLHTDDFFRDGAEAAGGDLALYYDHTALRRQALMPLRAGETATFPRRHWEEPDAAGRTVTVEPRPVVVLEGVSAAAPALADLVDRTVLVETPEPARHVRLRGRIADADWDDAWLDAERRYFATRPPASFDLVVSGTTATDATGASAPATAPAASVASAAPES